MISVLGYSNSSFGEHWDRSLTSLIAQVANEVLENTGLEKKEISAVFFANMLSGVLENNLHYGAKIASLLEVNIPVYRVEAACASGGIAFNLAYQYLRSNPNSNVLVIGAEKMTDYSSEQVSEVLMAASSSKEQESGLTFPGVYALMANYYFQKYKAKEEDLAYISVKNHYHGSLNPKAQFQKEITIENVLKSQYIASPLKVLDSSPISDGAASIILSNDKSLIKRAKHKIHVLTSTTATDTIDLTKRKRLDCLLATKIARRKAFKKTKITLSDIDVVELHDCFTIAEILAMEDIGFWKKGEGAKRARNMETMIGSGNRPIVNSSGGLKASGHPIGATGIKQIGEIFLQLNGLAGKRQVKKTRYGLTHNVGGSGGTVVINIFGS